MQRDVCTATKARSKETRVKVTGEKERKRESRKEGKRRD